MGTAPAKLVVLSAVPIHGADDDFDAKVQHEGMLPVRRWRPRWRRGQAAATGAGAGLVLQERSSRDEASYIMGPPNEAVTEEIASWSTLTRGGSCDRVS